MADPDRQEEQQRLEVVQETEIGPNRRQRELIETLEGLVVVDAGAGTGKTFTITRRYLELLRQRDLEPQDLLLITFTRNAAEEMRERILALGDDVDPAKLREAPIATFHALCHRVLKEWGFHAPRHLGLDEPLAPGFRVLENKVLEQEHFRAFLRDFRDAHPQHVDRFRAMNDPMELLGLIRSLSAKGIVPTRSGWYGQGERHLDGDREAFEDVSAEANATDGSKLSSLARSLSGMKARLIHPDHPQRRSDLLDPTEPKRIAPEALQEAFGRDRSELKGFVHDVYLAYLEHCLRRNKLTFGFLQVLAYVLLMEDHELRERLQYPYVCIDEFQDTSEVQFQLALLFCAEPNLCCVGDWKQSIYGFQYASVDNIRRFRQRLGRYASMLNRDRRRTGVTSGQELTVKEIALDLNYRSTQPILDHSIGTLQAPAKKDERVELDGAVVALTAHANDHGTQLEAFQAADEQALVLDRIRAMVGNPDYAVDDDEGGLRPPTWGDIAVLTRTRRFALQLQQRARTEGVPMAFEGGVELFATDEAKLLLAWLRVLADPDSDRGWAVVLEHAGYRLHEARHIVRKRDPPEEMLVFRRELSTLTSLGARARRIFDAYGLRNGFTEALVDEVQGAYEGTRKTPADLVAFLEDNLEAGTVVTVADRPGGDVVTAQTIHAAKGLEYPIVVLADVNRDRFPSTKGGGGAVITYDECTGLRQRKHYVERDGRGYCYDDAHAHVLDRCLPSNDYDEERRLLYVAVTRAKRHLVLTANTERPSTFFEAMADQPQVVEPTSGLSDGAGEAGQGETPPPLELAVPRAPSVRRLTVGQLVGEPETSGGRGPDYGARVHDFAARAVQGLAPEPATQDERAILRFLDDHPGTHRAELPCTLPLDVDGQRFVLEGKIDLLVDDGETLHVVDWKTVPAEEGLEVYARQVGLYAHVVQRTHPERPVRGWVVYTPDNHPVEVDPLERAEVVDLLRPRIQPR